MELIERVASAALFVAMAVILLADMRSGRASGRTLSWVWVGRAVYRSQSPEAFQRIMRWKAGFFCLVVLGAFADLLRLALAAA